MSADQNMIIDAGRKYSFTMRKRCVAGSKEERGRLFGKIEAVTGLYRKALTRLM
jgi:hypothetical protein